MQNSSKSLKALISFLLSFTVLTVFSITSYAIPEAAAGIPPAGVLMANGTVTVNGNTIKVGYTVLSGSVISTGTDGVAMIDLNAFGRLTIGPATNAKLTYSDDNLLIQTTCNDMRVSINQGQCNVADKNGLLKVMTAGQDEYFEHAVDVTANGLVDLVLNCGTDRVCPAPFLATSASELPILWGLFLLGGAATVVSVGIVAGGPKSSSPIISPVRP